MIKCVLLDLDNTLLINDPARFTTHYLAALNGFLRERLGDQDFERMVMAGVQAVIARPDPLRANLDRFYDVVDPLLPVDRAAFDAAVEEFYRVVYPRIQTITRRRSTARPLVEWLAAEGYRVVVATNPFFPRVAVEQRLAWAGLPVDEMPFALVTTLENMHATKPHAQYYEEILARVGVQADEAIMVGDEWDLDIAPAWRAGLNTFWIKGNSPPDAAPQGAIQPDDSGSLDDFAYRVREAHWLETLTPRPVEPSQIAPRLRGNLAALMSIADEIPPPMWPMRPDPEEWSPVEVMCHLVESEREVQRSRLQTILRGGNPFLSEPKAPPAPASRACPQDGRMLARQFAVERQRTLDLLASLDDSAWNTPARHYIFGPTTLLEMANFTAMHDRLHFTQLCRTVDRCQ